MIDESNLTFEDRLFVTNNLDEMLSILKSNLKPIHHGYYIEFDSIINELNQRTFNTILSISHLIKSDNINDVVQPISILLRASTLDLINIIYIFSYFEESIRIKDLNDNYKYVAIQLYIKQYEKLKKDFEFEKEILGLPTNPDSHEKEKIDIEIGKYDASMLEVNTIMQNCEKLLNKLHLGNSYDYKVYHTPKEQIKQYCKQELFYKYNNLYHFYTKYSKIDHFGALTKSIEQFSSKVILHDIIWLSVNLSQGFIYNLKMIEGEKFDLTFNKLKTISESLAKYGNEKLNI